MALIRARVLISTHLLLKDCPEKQTNDRLVWLDLKLPWLKAN